MQRPVTKTTNLTPEQLNFPAPERWTGPGISSISACLTKTCLAFARHGAQVAQLVEHRTENAGVGGSNPSLGTIFPLSPWWEITSLES
jgi:hypothetical protein